MLSSLRPFGACLSPGPNPSALKSKPTPRSARSGAFCPRRWFLRSSEVLALGPSRPCEKYGSRGRLHWPPVLHRLDHVRLQRLCQFTRPRHRHPELALWLCADAGSRHIPLGSAGADRARELRSRPVPEASVGHRTCRRADGRRHAHDARGQLHRQRPRRSSVCSAASRSPNPSPSTRPEPKPPQSSLSP